MYERKKIFNYKLYEFKKNNNNTIYIKTTWWRWFLNICIEWWKKNLFWKVYFCIFKRSENEILISFSFSYFIFIANNLFDKISVFVHGCARNFLRIFLIFLKLFNIIWHLNVWFNMKNHPRHRLACIIHVFVARLRFKFIRFKNYVTFGDNF